MSTSSRSPLRWVPGRVASGPISSLTNPLIKETVLLHRTKYRKSSGLLLLEGPTIVEEAVTAGVAIVDAFTTRPEAYPDATVVSPDVLGKLATTESARDVVAVGERPLHVLRPGAPVVVLVELAEPGNVGGLIRSAAAFGFQVLVSGGADPWSPKALRAGAGGHFHTPVVDATAAEVEQLRSEGWVTVATVPRSGTDLPSLGGVPALLVGNEAHGLDRDVIAAADHRWSLPTVGVESLNAASAGSVAMFELRRRIDAAEGEARE